MSFLLIFLSPLALIVIKSKRTLEPSFTLARMMEQVSLSLPFPFDPLACRLFPFKENAPSSPLLYALCVASHNRRLQSFYHFLSILTSRFFFLSNVRCFVLFVSPFSRSL